jgi:putative IMPACT (imprinted ancient) family translation regulator
MPVLEAIKKLNVIDVVVVVTRYFVGSLLGAAGLVKAYGKCAALGIEAAGIIKKQLCVKMNLIVEYDLLGKMQNLISSCGYAISEAEYGLDVEIAVYVPLQEYDMLAAKINEAANARVLIARGETEYITAQA